MKLSKEVKVGLLAVISGSLLYIGFNFLKGIDFFSPNNSYYAVYDNIDGLGVSNPVMINGLTVGRVGEISIMQNKGNKILVGLDIDDGIQLGESTVALLVDSDLLGSKAIVLQVGKVQDPKQEGDTLIGLVDIGITEAIKETAMPVINNIDSTVSNFNRILANITANEEAVNQVIENFRKTSDEVRLAAMENRQSITNITTDFSKLSNALADDENGLIPTLANLNQFTDTLNNLELTQVMAKANLAMENLNAVLEEINKGQGTLGKMAKNDSLYNNLNQSARDLDRLLIDLRQNPRRYLHFSVFGRKDKSNNEEEVGVE